MKMIAKYFFVGLFVLGLSNNSYATDFNYNYAQVAYDDIDITSGGITVNDADGFSFAGSFEVTPDIFVTASYSIWDLESVIDFDTWKIGGGYHMSLQTETDLVIEALIGNSEVSSAFASIDNDIWSVSVGVRHNLSEKLELGGKIAITDYENKDGTDTEVDINALYNFQQNIAGIVSLHIGDDVDVISLGARSYF